MFKIQIENLDLEVDHRDSGGYRSYELSCEGNTLEQCMETAYIAEIDQDGGELDTYPLDDSDGDVFFQAVYQIKRAIMKVSA